MQQERRPRLLIIDDEPGMAASISDLAEELGCEAYATDNPSHFKRIYNAGIDIVVLDLLMPQVDGVELIRYLSEQDCKSGLILMSGFDSHVLNSAAELAKAQGLQVLGALRKPLLLRDLQALIEETSLPATVQLDAKTLGIEPRDVAAAIEKRQLSVCYQPKICLKERKVQGLEALARWEHPKHGFVSPALFIPLAEETELIDPLTEFVLQAALADSSPWLQSSLIEEVAVNLSATMLTDLSLPERILGWINDAELSVSQLVLEITETALVREVVKSLDVLTRLRMKGIRLAIDDFGTGYSTMQQLQRYPFTELKIDRAFVKNLETDVESRAIVDTTIDLGRRLGMRVVAEGVETQGALDYLRDHGCDLAQGYFISRPMPAAATTTWLREWKG